MPNPQGSVMPDGPRQLVLGAIFDPTWKETHKFNFAAMFLYSLGWYFGIFGIIGTFSFFSCALANKHKHYAKMEISFEKKNKPTSLTTVAESKTSDVNISVEETVRELAQMQ